MSTEILDESCHNGRCDTASVDSGTCVAIRGNGPLITSHWHALARITEEYGAPVGFAGGSSGSVTGFLYESILLNPAIKDNPETRDEKIALMLKSLVALPSKLKKETEALSGEIELIKKFKSIEQGGQRLSDVVAPLGREQIISMSNNVLSVLNQNILSSDIINPVFVGLIRVNLDNLIQGKNIDASLSVLEDLILSIKSFGSFAAPDTKMFVRPGLVNFDEFSRRIGFVGNFYAGGDYSHAIDNRMNQWLETWSKQTKGLTWFDIENDYPNCALEFLNLLNVEQDAFSAGKTTLSNRLTDDVGEFSPSLVTTSIVTGDSVLEIERAIIDYRLGIEPRMAVDWKDVKFGYWGNENDVAQAQLGLSLEEDPKFEKSIILGSTSWKNALSLSPAEPGLASVLPLGNGHYSAGGWSDLHPVNALKNVPGCDQVIFLTRRGQDSTFAQGTARALGLEDTAQFSNLENPNSSFSKAVKNADVTWCTDWDNYDKSDIEALAEDAYRAPAQVNSEQATPFYEKALSYKNASPDLFGDGIDAIGCSLIE